jgi:hypothetical protein
MIKSRAIEPSQRSPDVAGLSPAGQWTSAGRRRLIGSKDGARSETSGLAQPQRVDLNQQSRSAGPVWYFAATLRSRCGIEFIVAGSSGHELALEGAGIAWRQSPRPIILSPERSRLSPGKAAQNQLGPAATAHASPELCASDSLCASMRVLRCRLVRTIVRSNSSKPLPSQHRNRPGVGVPGAKESASPIGLMFVVSRAARFSESGTQRGEA